MRMLAIAGLAIGVLAVGGCTANENEEVREEVAGIRQQVETAAERTRQAAANATLAGTVKTALLSRKGLKAGDIDVEARSAHVILKGDVADAQQAELAEQVAMETEGVTSVDNQLMVRVPAKTTRPVTPPEPTGTMAAPEDGASREPAPLETAPR